MPCIVCGARSTGCWGHVLHDCLDLVDHHQDFLGTPKDLGTVRDITTSPSGSRSILGGFRGTDSISKYVLRSGDSFTDGSGYASSVPGIRRCGHVLVCAVQRG
eukprot:3377275-Pyramimonas_sp.AAC.1